MWIKKEKKRVIEGKGRKVTVDKQRSRRIKAKGMLQVNGKENKRKTVK